MKRYNLRSCRLQSSLSGTDTPEIPSREETTKNKKRRKCDKLVTYLPRTREEVHNKNGKRIIIGCDEAGRGPLAGPVLAAAISIPTNIVGVIDSKKVTKEIEREKLYEKIINSPSARYAISVVDAKRIDEINILNATMEAMKNAAEALITFPRRAESLETKTLEEEISTKIEGCYTVCKWNDESGHPIEQIESDVSGEVYFALIDGNRTPAEMPCDSETIVKGDAREYSIAAASILAKVSRDRLMHEYHKSYPEYELDRHKGYPTSVHMSKIEKFGASPIHRKTFAPLKHMKLS